MQFEIKIISWQIDRLHLKWQDQIFRPLKYNVCKKLKKKLKKLHDTLAKATWLKSASMFI
jgi:hypothetical protein